MYRTAAYYWKKLKVNPLRVVIIIIIIIIIIQLVMSERSLEAEQTAGVEEEKNKFSQG